MASVLSRLPAVSRTGFAGRGAAALRVVLDAAGSLEKSFQHAFGGGT